MNEAIEQTVNFVARMVPLSVYRACIKRDFIVLCYHVVSPRPLPHIKHFSYKTPEAFERDIRYLKDNYTLISYKQLLAHIRGEQKLTTRAALLTFDDGLSQCFSYVRPILKKYEAPCVFFITTDIVDNKTLIFEHKISLCIDKLQHLSAAERQIILQKIESLARQKYSDIQACIRWLLRLKPGCEEFINALCDIMGICPSRYLKEEKPYLTQDQIRTLALENFTIGAHGVHHILLDLLNEAQAEKEIYESTQAVMSWLGIKSLPFAFAYHGQMVDKKFLSNMRRKYPFIDIFFDTQLLRKNEQFVVNRIWADNPNHAKENSSNIPVLLKQAYMDCLVDALQKNS